MTALLCFSAFCMGAVVVACLVVPFVLALLYADAAPVTLTRPLDCFTNPDLFRAPTDRGSR